MKKIALICGWVRRIILCGAAVVFSTQAAYAFSLNIITNNNAQGERMLQLVSANPYDQQKLQQSPESVTLTFTQPIRPEKSSIKVLDSFGTRLDDGDLSSTGMKLAVQLPALPPGRYTVKWKVRCQCDSDTEISDVYHFTVR